jgi:hypothetical protein
MRVYVSIFLPHCDRHGMRADIEIFPFGTHLPTEKYNARHASKILSYFKTDEKRFVFDKGYLSKEILVPKYRTGVECLHA